VCGPAGFQGACRACELTFTGAAGAEALYAHRNAVHPPNTWDRDSRKRYRTPTWANGKALPWVAPKPSKVHTLAEILEGFVEQGVEVYAS